MNVEKDDDRDQEEAVGSHEVAGHVIDLQKTNVEDCRYRSECYQEQSDHRRDVSNPFQCFHSSKIYNSSLIINNIDFFKGRLHTILFTRP